MIGVCVDAFLEKALETANLMTTLANQKRSLTEEYEQSLFYFFNGGTFKSTRETISFVQSLLSNNYVENVVIIDDNGLPVLVENLKDFFDALLDKYVSASNNFHTKYQSLKKSRNIQSILDL